MVKIVADTALLTHLHDLNTVLEFCDASGQTLGYFQPISSKGKASNTSGSPFSIEELQRRRQQRTGRPLSEILKRLLST